MEGISMLQVGNPPPQSDAAIISAIAGPKLKPRSGLRIRLSRMFGQDRVPREARSKSPTHPKPVQRQAQDTSTLLPYPPAALDSPAHQTRTIRRSASVPAVSRGREQSPHFIGLGDRLAKVPMAVPKFVKKVDFQLPTDNTMATRGSGSNPLDSGADLVDNASASSRSVDVVSGISDGASMRVLPDDKKKRSAWASIKRKAKAVFGRKKE
ncbi:MAG: hypothetical protein Q9166_004756 [cf. Caloplaca sp. 2 TL-2023]